MIARREFLAGLGATAVLGYNPVARAWVPSGGTSGHLKHVPHLDGELLMDPTSLAAAARDVGNIISETPRAVLRPGSARDIQKMVRFCRRHRIDVAARGQGHTTYGQAQVEGGLVVDMGTLNTIHSIDDTSAELDAGATWRQLIETTVPMGLTVPALTGYINLSIGGTLSVGGISATYNQGAQVDRVRELEVVTGRGDLVRCSERHHRDLFEGLLAGLGQLGIITRAVVDLVPAPPFARVYIMNYTDNATFFADFRTLLDRSEFDDIANLWMPDASGGFSYQLNAAKLFDPASPPNDAHLVRGLNFDPGSLAINDAPYLDYALRVDVVIDFFRSIGLFDDVQHPWFDVFLADSEVEQYVGDVIPALTPEDVGPTGFMLLFAQKRSKLTRPFLRIPDGSDDWVYLFDILTAAPTPGPNPAFVEQMLDRNRTLFDKARDVGGTRYPISAIPFSRSDWVRQYGRDYLRFARLKRRYDPQGILAPGPRIF